MTEDVKPVTPVASNGGDSNAVRTAAIVITLVMTIGALRLARAFALPVMVAVLLTLLLSTPVRWLRQHRISERLGAAIVVFGALALAATAATLLAAPAVDWMSTAPATLQKVESKLRRIAQPIAALQKSADRMQEVTTVAAPDAPRQVQIAKPGLFERVSMSTVEAMPAALSVVFLTYFLLASGPLFRRKLAEVLPGRRDVKHFEHLLSEIEIVTSRYLATTTMINTGVGVATAGALWAVGVPNAPLWGAVAAVLNFVPYLGPLATAIIVALAALASIDEPSRAVLAPAAFIVIHLTENNFVTPVLLGRRLPVNTVAIFLGLLFFAWVWGIPGAVLAVPLTVVIKVACDHVPALHHVGELLGN
jgi:predicted PurR-regulated permease PerM